MCSLLAGNQIGCKDSGHTEFTFGSATIRVSIVKNSTPTPAQKDSAKVEDSKKQEENKIVGTGLQSLWQSYGTGSDDDDE